MDQVKTGKLIRQLRTQMGLTQKEIAWQLHVSDKAVSKWECGKGCPDLSLLNALSEVFNTNIQVLLSGELNKNESEEGNMKKLKFYVCRECGNIITASTDAQVSCCGSTLTALDPKKAEPGEQLKAEENGYEWYITSSHPMTKEHYISFVAYLSGSSVMIFRQYPEWDISINMPLLRSGRLIWYCSKCGLLYQELGDNG